MLVRNSANNPDSSTMLQISENAAALIKKMTAKNGIPDGGLRIAIKIGRAHV